MPISVSSIRFGHILVVLLGFFILLLIPCGRWTLESFSSTHFENIQTFWVPRWRHSARFRSGRTRCIRKSFGKRWRRSWWNLDGASRASWLKPIYFGDGHRTCYLSISVRNKVEQMVLHERHSFLTSCTANASLHNNDQRQYRHGILRAFCVRIYRVRNCRPLSGSTLQAVRWANTKGSNRAPRHVKKVKRRTVTSPAWFRSWRRKQSRIQTAFSRLSVVDSCQFKWALFSSFIWAIGSSIK
jgi:hypothetical protein